MKTPMSHRNPSWSWASVDHAVSFISPGGHFWQCQVLESGCIPANKHNQKGEVLSGFVSIRSRLLESKLSYYVDHGKPSSPQTFLVYIGGLSYHFMADYDPSASGTHHLARESSLYLLCMRCSPEKFAALVLIPAKHEPNNPIRSTEKTFKRIGILSHSLSDKEPFGMLVELLGKENAYRLDQIREIEWYNPRVDETLEIIRII
jgi:hypothetical protein